ncbi:MAG: M14 family zinc carboxypeptidase, partial [Wenzhouxiangella sp.]|nr:M14 family zinc carboxypeptidase [Wenzhouxiangella sp.]
MHPLLQRLSAFVLIGWLILPVSAATGLPADFDPDPAIPSPADVFGFEPGEWHPRHDQIVTYLERLAAASDRVKLDVIGQSHGMRPLVLLTFASPERLADIDAVRDDRVRASRAGDGPPVIWMGYTVHGNEASTA